MRKKNIEAPDADRLGVRKTYKLYIGGAFPRSESGRSYPVKTPRARSPRTPHLPRARMRATRSWPPALLSPAGRARPRTTAVRCCTASPKSWKAAATSSSTRSGPPKVSTAKEAAKTVDAAIDRCVWYAGWTDKVAQVVGAANPVAGPYFDFSVPEPTGVVAIVAPQASSLLGLVSVLLPVIATGNTTVVLASEERPLPAITLTEVLATSDLPGGVVNMLTGKVAEVAPWLASHSDVNGIDLTGAPLTLWRELEAAAADNLKRVRRPHDAEPDWSPNPGTDRLTTFLETKTVWHPIGV
jgi:hypothetical protein